MAKYRVSRQSCPLGLYYIERKTFFRGWIKDGFFPAFTNKSHARRYLIETKHDDIV